MFREAGLAQHSTPSMETNATVTSSISVFSKRGILIIKHSAYAYHRKGRNSRVTTSMRMIVVYVLVAVYVAKRGVFHVKQAIM